MLSTWAPEQADGVGPSLWIKPGSKIKRSFRKTRQVRRCYVPIQCSSTGNWVSAALKVGINAF